MRKRVSAFVDGELSSTDAAAVAEHLRGCWDCSGAAEQDRLIKASLVRHHRRDPRPLSAVRLRRWATALVRRGASDNTVHPNT